VTHSPRRSVPEGARDDAVQMPRDVGWRMSGREPGEVGAFPLAATRV
jgi:hypothetical protein